MNTRVTHYGFVMEASINNIPLGGAITKTGRRSTALLTGHFRREVLRETSVAHLITIEPDGFVAPTPWNNDG